MWVVGAGVVSDPARRLAVEVDVVVLDRAGRTLYAGDVIVGSGESGRVSVYRGQDRTDWAKVKRTTGARLEASIRADADDVRGGELADALRRLDAQLTRLLNDDKEMSR